MKFVAKILTIAAALSSLSMGSSQVTVDNSIKPYAPSSGVSGNLNAVGSDTLNNLMTLWAEGFSKKYPSVKIGVEGKGSSTAPPALTAGTAQLAPMSRQMKREEIAAFEAKYGYKPTEIKVEEKRSKQRRIALLCSIAITGVAALIALYLSVRHIIDLFF